MNAGARSRSPAPVSRPDSMALLERSRKLAGRVEH